MQPGALREKTWTPSKMNPFVIDKPAQRWLFKTAQKNYWRIQSWYELDDLIQDGYMTWCMVADRYADSVRERCKGQPEDKRDEVMGEVMMALFIRCYTNHIHDLASKRSRITETALSELVHDNQSHEQFLDQVFGSDASTSDEAELINLAPDGVRQVLQTYNDHPDSPKINAQFRVRRDGTRETFNERLCKLAGRDPKSVDLVKAVHSYLTGKDDTDSMIDRMVSLLVQRQPSADEA